MQKDDKIYLLHIRDSINNIQEYLEGYTQETFFFDKKTKDAVVRNFEIIGEATKRISIGYRELHSNVPWKEMAGMRDVMIHDYMGIDWWQVWKIATEDISSLKIKIENLLAG